MAEGLVCSKSNSKTFINNPGRNNTAFNPKKRYRLLHQIYYEKMISQREIEYQKRWYQKNKDKKKEYYQNNKDKLKEYRKDYWQKNKDIINYRQNEYYQNNKDKSKEYRQKNKKLIADKIKKWRKKNPEYIKEYNQNHPEAQLKAQKKCLEKLTNPFNKSIFQYKMTLAAWRKVIKKRDQSCAVCGSKNNLDAHHIIHRSKYPELSFLENNGIILCRTHHYEAHGKTM